MKGNLKQKKGITLIALVITIIVLLILAGVSIATLTGENGILTQANEAKEKTKEGEDIENIKLAINESQIEKGEDDKKTEEAKLKEIIEKNTGKYVGVSGKQEDGSYVVTIGDKEYIVQGASIERKEAGITDKQIILNSSTDVISFNQTIKESDIKNDYPNYKKYEILGVSTEETGEYKNEGEVQGKAGKLKIVGDIAQTKFEYKVEKPMLEDETFFVKVKVDEQEILQKLEVIQGDIVRYEEDVFKFIDNENATGEEGCWIDVYDPKYSGGKAKMCVATDEFNELSIEAFGFNGKQIGFDCYTLPGGWPLVSFDFTKDGVATYSYTVCLDLDDVEKRYVLLPDSPNTIDDERIDSFSSTIEYINYFDPSGSGSAKFILDAIDIYKK